MNEVPFFLSLICSAYMCGIIWLIQLIQYPSFEFIEKSEFPAVHAKHTALMGFIVGPVMIVELIAGIGLIFSSVERFISISNLVLVVMLWLLTFFVSVPLHNKLSSGYDAGTIAKLVKTNWPRTFFWTAKLLLLVFSGIRF